MIAHAIVFYIFSLIAIVSAIMVTVSKNTVNSVFFLMIRRPPRSTPKPSSAASDVYKRQVMMLNVAQQKNEWFNSSGRSSHIPVGLLVSIIIFFELIIVIGGWKYKPDLLDSIAIEINTDLTNTQSLGSVIYTDYIHLFQLSGMVLLVAMIGAIVLTFRQRSGVKRQSYFKQISRDRKDGIELVDVENNKGVKIDA